MYLPVRNAAGCRQPARLMLALLLAFSSVAVDPATARTSRDDLVNRIVSSLSAELPDDVRGIAIMQLTNKCGAPLNMDQLREDLELELIGAPRFDFVNRSLLEAALAEMDLCVGMACFIDPATLQRFGRARGIDAMLIGEVIESSISYPGLDSKDYFTTIVLRAISTSTASVVWQKEIMGINKANVVDLLGALPEQQAVTREEAFGRVVADFLGRSQQVRNWGTRTVSLMNFENRSGQSIDMDVLFRYLSIGIVERTGLALVDREYMEEYLKEQGLWFDRITEANQRVNIGRLYGIDAFVYGQIREVSKDRIECDVRINDVEANVDIEAGRLTATAENMEWYLPRMLLNAGPSRFTSEPAGAVVAVNGKNIGTTPCEYRLVNGPHQVEFNLFGYDTHASEVISSYGQVQTVHAKLDLSYSQVSIVTRPAGAEVSVDGEPKGRAPVSNLQLPYGTYRVSAKRAMFEKLSRDLMVDGSQHEFILQMTPKSRSKAIIYSAILSGSGQQYKGQAGKGWLFTLGMAGSAGFALVNEGARKSAVDDYEKAYGAYMNAVTQVEMDRQFAIMQDKWGEAEDKKELRDIGWMVCGGIWLLNVIDAALGWPAADAGVTFGMAPVESGVSGVVVTFWR